MPMYTRGSKGSARRANWCDTKNSWRLCCCFAGNVSRVESTPLAFINLPLYIHFNRTYYFMAQPRTCVYTPCYTWACMLMIIITTRAIIMVISELRHCYRSVGRPYSHRDAYTTCIREHVETTIIIYFSSMPMRCSRVHGVSPTQRFILCEIRVRAFGMMTTTTLFCAATLSWACGVQPYMQHIQFNIKSTLLCRS